MDKGVLQTEKSRTINILFVIFLISLVAVGYLWFKDNGGYKEKLEEIRNQRDSLQVDLVEIEDKYDSLEAVKTKIEYVYIQTEKKLKKQEDETDAIPGIVATYSERKLDSILTNHRFKARTKSRDSLNP